jgi:FkbM family methyltransferase
MINKDKFKFYGQCRYNVDRLIYDRYFTINNLEGKGICFECGAADGVSLSSTKFFEESLGWKSINVEGLPESYGKLVINRPLSTNINAILSNEDGKTYIRKNKADILCSEVVLDNDGDTFSVREATYKTIIDDLKIPYLNLMVLDVEGHEPEALDGMIGCSVLPDILCCEFNRRNPENPRTMDKIIKLGYVEDFRYKFNRFFKKI